jgi:enoyl-CoA hydratase
MAETLVHLQRRDRVALITLDHPERRNALTRPMIEQIGAAFDEVEADESIGAVVVTGAGKAFCAGADLAALAMEGISDDDRAASLRGIYTGFLRLASCPLPTVAAVNGAAVGAGLNMALAADVRIAGTSARFITRFLEIGLHPGGGATWLLDRIVGPQTAAAMVLFGETVDGPTSATLGLSHRCVADASLVDDAVAFAAVAASAPRELVVRVKQTMRAAPTICTHADAVELETGPQVWSTTQPFAADLLASMRTKVSGK